MKGLLKNDRYATAASARVFGIFMLLFGVFAVAFISQSLQISFGMCAIIGFSYQAAAIVKNASACKWGKYKLTLPVKRREIVRSLFLNQLLWMLVGTAFAAVEIGLSWLLHGCCFDQPVDIVSLFALGISMSLFMGAIFYPLVFIGGEEKADVFLIISLLCAFALVFAIVTVCNDRMEPGIFTVLIGDLILMGCGALAMLLSYPLAAELFKRKEF